MTYVEGSTPQVNVNLQNFKGIQDEVLQFGFNDGPQVNRNRIKAWINEAQFLIAREVEAPEFQETENLALAQGVFRYALPELFLRMQDIYYPEMRTRLRPVDLQQFDLTAQGLLEGPPSIYTLYKSELWLFPTPNNSTDELLVRYMQKPPALVKDADIPLLSPDYWHLLVDYALGRAFKAEDDEEAAQAHLTQYKADLAAYATDTQDQFDDRPRVLDGTWGGGSTYGY